MPKTLKFYLIIFLPTIILFIKNPIRAQTYFPVKLKESIAIISLK